MQLCTCGNKLNGFHGVSVFDTYISTVTQCPDCNRRIHRMFSITSESVFLDGELESSVLIKETKNCENKEENQ
ncbi:hypothetical protein [Romboutsia sp.]|uniref:hypothetical protein n=1 Tax=Romboutsia sp. TaxID=1965302 RepID=UPI002BD55284|nr:hypothetical protein [Romboutsia sp.]HSQ89803.1 hypothetical protein [Romboutsia sp.]